MFYAIEIHTPDRKGWDVFDESSPYSGRKYIGFIDGGAGINGLQLLNALHLNNFGQVHTMMQYEVTAVEFDAKMQGPKVKRDGDYLKDGCPVRLESTNAGCIFDGAMGWHNNYRVIDLARERGMTYSDHDETILNAYKTGEESVTIGEGDPVDVTEAVIGQYEMLDQAIEWLNENIAPAGYHFHFEGDFYLSEIEDEDQDQNEG